MRNAFVVLVFLCIGLVSGFIVPRRMPENTSKSSMEEKSNASDTKFAVLPNSRNHIDEKDLYEHAKGKQNNQSERAFIYINQKFKKPVRNKIIKMPSLERIDLGHSLVTPTATFTSEARTPCPINFDPRNSNSYFQGLDLEPGSGKQALEMESYFASPNIFRCNLKEDSKKKYKVSEKLKTQVPMSNRADVRRDYFELLKPPILRPVSRLNSKKTYDAIHPNQFPAPASIKSKDNYIKKYNFKNKFSSNTQTADEREEMRKNYVFDRPYAPHRVFDNKELLPGVENVNFRGDFMNEEDSHRLYEGNPEDDKLLDKYLKDTLEEQAATSNDKVRNSVDCSYQDCILKSTKHYRNNGLLLKPECKCKGRLNIKQTDPFHAKDRSLREETKHNDTALSGEVNYYEELLNEDSNLIKSEDDVIRPPLKHNTTSRN